MERRILLVEDTVAYSNLLQEYLKEAFGQSIKVETVTSFKTLREKLLERSFDLVLLDLNLPNSTGVDTFDAVSELVMDTPIIVVSGVNDEEVRLHTLLSGGVWYSKNNSLAELQTLIIISITEKTSKDTKFLRLERRLDVHAQAIKPVVQKLGELVNKLSGSDGIIEQVKTNTKHRELATKGIWLVIGAAIAAVAASISANFL